MEFEDLRELGRMPSLPEMDFEFEMRRHRVAFGVRRWKVIGCSLAPNWGVLIGRRQGMQVECHFGFQGAWALSVNSYLPSSYFFHIALGFIGEPYSETDIHMPASKEGVVEAAILCLARAAWCLGHSIEDLEAQVGRGQLLTTHEKLELSLNFPREFWPQKWLDQEVS